MTKREMYAQIMAMVEGNEVSVTVDEVKDFCTHEIELLAKKNGSTKPTKNQVANEGIKATILDVLATNGKPMTISAIMEDSRLEGLKNQKISALMTLLKKENLVVRTEDKRVAYFALASVEASDESEVVVEA